MSASSESGGVSDDAKAYALSRGASASLAEDALTVELAVGAPMDAAGKPSTVEPEPGTVLGSRYRLEQLIGRGGTSSVYRARDLYPEPCAEATTHRVAVKLSCNTPRTGSQATARLQREFHTMRRLSHAGIARVFELDCDGELCFMSMQLIAGRTLKSWMLQSGTHAEALRIIDTCCEALEYAHSMGIVHGDLKPTNILVSDDGTAKLIDFGSSSIPGAAAQGADPTAAATPLYASPQVLAGQRAGPLDDVFSLACLSYSILSGGRHPYGGHPSFEGFRAKSAPTYVRAIAPELFEVIERGLSAERDRRPASVSEFRRELNEAEQRRRAKASQPPPAPIVVQSARPSILASAVARVGPGIALFGKTLGRRFGLVRVKPRVISLVVLMIAMAGAAVLFASVESVRSRHAGTDRLPIASLATPAVRAISLHASAPPPATAATAPARSAPPVPEPAAPSAVPSAKSMPLPQDASSISFEAALVHASARQSMVAITVRRAPASRNPGAFVWRVERGSAVPTIDYERIKPRRANFIEGQTVRTLFIPLLNDTSHAPHGPRFFDVVLQPVAGGPALGRLTRITVVVDPTPAIWVANSAPRSSPLR